MWYLLTWLINALRLAFGPVTKIGLLGHVDLQGGTLQSEVEARLRAHLGTRTKLAVLWGTCNQKVDGVVIFASQHCPEFVKLQRPYIVVHPDRVRHFDDAINTLEHAIRRLLVSVTLCELQFARVT
jgi:hypothetical protein